MAVEGKARGTQEEGFYTTSTMTVFYVISRINWEGYKEFGIFAIKPEVD